MTKAISSVLSAMYNAELPRSVHIEDILIKEMRKCKQQDVPDLPSKVYSYPSMHPIPKFTDSEQEWKNYMWWNVLRTGIHQHSFTCHKPPAGSHRCRGGHPVACCDVTGPTELICPEVTPDIPLSQVLPEALNEPIQPFVNAKERYYFCHPIEELTNHMIGVWELKRPKLALLPQLPTYIMNAYNSSIQLFQPSADNIETALTLAKGRSF